MALPRRCATPPPFGRLVLLAVLLGSAGCVSIPLTEDDLFDPRRSVNPTTYERSGATLEERSIPSSDPEVSISAWWLEVEEPRATVLFFGGRDFHLVQSANYLNLFAELSVNALLVDYRGYGDSEGEPSLEAARADAREAHSYVTDALGVAEGEVVVHGHSIGAYPALSLADQRGAGGVVLENPLSRARDWERAQVPWFGRIFLSVDFDSGLRAINNITHIRRTSAPVYIVAGGADRVIPPDLARDLYDEAVSEYREIRVIEGGGHNDLNLFEEYRDGYRRLLEELEAG